MKRHPPVKLVTPVAMDIEQAQSKLRKTEQLDKKCGKASNKKKMSKARKPKNTNQKTKKPRYQDNFV